MRTARAPFAIVGVLALGMGTACDRPPPAASVAPPPTTPTTATAQVDAPLVSVLAATMDRTLRLRLAAPFAQALALDNCNGAFQWGLERQAADAWQQAWSAETDACASAPIVIAAGTSREFTVAITGPDGDALGAGTYRAVVHGLHAVPPGGERVELPAIRRTSAAFPYPPDAAPR